MFYHKNKILDKILKLKTKTNHNSFITFDQNKLTND